MATIGNPFLNLATRLSTSSLGMAAVQKNLERRYVDRRPKKEGDLAPSTQAASTAASPFTPRAASAPSLPSKASPATNVRAVASAASASLRASIRGDQEDADGSNLPSAAPPASNPFGKRAAFLVTESAAPEASAPVAKKGGLGGGATAATPARRSGGLGGSVESAPIKPWVAPPFNDQQKAVIHCSAPLIVVDAFAGCGKTTTAMGWAQARPNMQILYLCLNTANATEATEKFASMPWVKVMTTHALARRAIKPPEHKVTSRWNQLLVMDQMKLRNGREALLLMKVLTAFFNSADSEISRKHVMEVAKERDMSAQEMNNAEAYAKLAWRNMWSADSEVQMPHDAYLKKFALTAPSLPYQAIIFDEAQDANPVTLQIVQGQMKKIKQILCIGDRHQAIYQFRGAVNAMEILAQKAAHFYLSNTFRFGSKVAEIANLLLSELKQETTPINGLGTDAAWAAEKVAHLSRTNAELFRVAAERRGEGIHWVGGAKNYRIDLVMDAYHLWARERELINDKLMKTKFLGWDDYKGYSEDAADGEAKVLVKLVEEHGHNTPQLIQDILDNEVENEADASLILTTAHKSKGLEWDYVRIADDFEVLEEAEGTLADANTTKFPVGEVNLLYVAATRARKAVQVNTDTLEWIQKLPEYRSNREAANARREADLQDMRARFGGEVQRATAPHA